MSLLRLSQSLIDALELRVLLDLSDGAIERRAVPFVLPISHILGRFIGVSHQSLPRCVHPAPLLSNFCLVSAHAVPKAAGRVKRRGFVADDPLRFFSRRLRPDQALSKIRSF